jgi:hypothetical protein
MKQLKPNRFCRILVVALSTTAFSKPEQFPPPKPARFQLQNRNHFDDRY